MEKVTTRLVLAGLLMLPPVGAAKAGGSSSAEAAMSNDACSATTASIYLKDTMRVRAFEENRAIYVASRAFQSIGVRLMWRQGTPPKPLEGGCDQIIELQIDLVAPESYPPSTMAYATPRATSGTRIHVFYDRVSRLSPDAPNLFGYVLAHEIAHVLQGKARHSGEGIMKPHWDGSDYSLMGVYGLRFTDEDAALILNHAKANRGVVSSPAEF
jgi:hypothetical protein